MKVRFKSIGAVAQIEPSTVSFPPETRMSAVQKYLQQSLDLNNQPIWLYVGNAFVPSMDSTLQSIADMNNDGSLIFTYSIVEAFG